MIKINIYLLLFFAIISCNKQPKCNDKEVQNLLISTIKKDISNKVEKEFMEDDDFRTEDYYSYLLPLLKNRTKHLDELELKPYNIRSTEIKEDIKKCDCEAELNMIEKNTHINSFPIDILDGEFKLNNYTPTIKFSAQKTDDKKIIVSVNNIDDLEILKNNITAKVINDMRIKYKEILASKGNKNYSKDYENSANDSTSINTNNEIIPGNYYYVNGSAGNPVFFYNSPNHNDRKSTKFTTYEKVYVESISNDFGFIRFTNTNNQTSKGWIRFVDLNN